MKWARRQNIQCLFCEEYNFSLKRLVFIENRALSSTLSQSSRILRFFILVGRNERYSKGGEQNPVQRYVMSRNVKCTFLKSNFVINILYYFRL